MLATWWGSCAAETGSVYEIYENWAGLGSPDMPSPPLIDDGIFDGGDENQIINLINTAQFSIPNHAVWRPYVLIKM